MWTATITAVSQVDSSGNFEITVNVLLDGVIKYSNIVLRGSDKAEMTEQVKVTLRDFKKKDAEAKKFNIGDVISIV